MHACVLSDVTEMCVNRCVCIIQVIEKQFDMCNNQNRHILVTFYIIDTPITLVYTDLIHGANSFQKAVNSSLAF